MPNCFSLEMVCSLTTVDIVAGIKLQWKNFISFIINGELCGNPFFRLKKCFWIQIWNVVFGGTAYRTKSPDIKFCFWFGI